VRQPWLGLIASAIGIVLALLFISLFAVPQFLGPVAFYMLCTVPFQVMVVVLWGANPSFLASLTQPSKGLALLLLTLVAAAIIDPLVLRLVGEGVTPPGPIPTHFAIIVVPTTFFLAIVWGGWPFNLLGLGEGPVAGLLLLAVSYALTWVGFRFFFDYSFLEGAPVYLASAPHGLFNAVDALVFYVTALAVMFLVLCFDLWPFTRTPSLMQQPTLGLVWMLVCLLGAALARAAGGGTDPMVFLTRVTAPFIFGCIIVLNMFQGSLFAPATQPVKGGLTAAAAGAIGFGLYLAYRGASPLVSGRLPAGPPGYEYEIWIANALLSVTFPLLIVIAAYFAYWPLTGKGR
jgi:hypothetical protein